ncbi:hypothetical protein CYMTET_33207 [Cymbomonas tetramitiformis]|uniref:USP8 dimerisation domain-containing protein n=1 Tax=Cymbomonas tetramitiformis TaxID=36881 RepID=A0AAE0KR74_9CHLO|nr:hypothetical protein CYMTET_33207 [Cymbomonas tetramitiformis]
MAESSPKTRTAELSEQAPPVEIVHTLPLHYYFRAAEQTFQQASIFRTENDYENLYILLLRYTSLVLETLPQHSEFKDAKYAKLKNEHKKKLMRALSELEDLRGIINARADAVVANAVEAGPAEPEASTELKQAAAPTDEGLFRTLEDLPTKSSLDGCPAVPADEQLDAVAVPAVDEQLDGCPAALKDVAVDGCPAVSLLTRAPGRLSWRAPRADVAPGRRTPRCSLLIAPGRVVAAAPR